MRVQRLTTPTKDRGSRRVWAELRSQLWDRADLARHVWVGRLRDRRWQARACLAAGGVLALILLLVWGAYAQVHRTIALGVERRLARSSLLAPVKPVRPPNLLPTLYLDLEADADRALTLQRYKAQRAGILLPQDVLPVDAQVRVARPFSGLQRLLERRAQPGTPVQVRLAGSRCDGVHPADGWQPAKWSLEVEALPGTTVLDVGGFALRSPAPRGYLDGWLYQGALHRAGLPVARTAFVNLVLNGESWGFYLVEPALDPVGTAWFETLEAEQQGRLLAHADLWEQGIPGACPRGTDPGAQARRLLQEDPRARAAYESELARITRPEYLHELRLLHRRAFDRYQRALQDEFFGADLVAPWERLLTRQAVLAAGGGAARDATGERPPSEVEWPLLGSGDAILPPVPAETALPSLEAVLDQHPFLVRSERPGFLDVKPGEWAVRGDLLLPPGVGLWAEQAFSLRFERGAALVARGPLVLHGPEGSPIRLLPQAGHWAGVRVLDADPSLPSSWHNVEVRGVRGAPGEGELAAAEAGLFFYRSPVHLERCRVLDSYAPAALSIVGTSFDLYDSELGAASGDLFQARVAQGAISRAAFHDALGAGLRLDESAVEVVDVSVLRVAGAALRAGPESLVAVAGFRADEVDVGLASVGARMRARDVRVERAATAGFLAHSMARLEVDQALLDGTAGFLVQEGSEAALDGAPVEAVAFAPGELRPTEEPAPPMRPLGVRFGPSIWLVGYQLTTPERLPGETIEVILYWRAFAYLDRQYTVFMHVRNAAGETVAGWDMMPRYNTFPTTDWPLVERIDDVHIVPLPNDLPPGEYTVALGMYDWATGVRLPATARAGEALPDATLILEARVTVKAPAG